MRDAEQKSLAVVIINGQSLPPVDTPFCLSLLVKSVGGGGGIGTAFIAKAIILQIKDTYICILSPLLAGNVGEEGMCHVTHV